MDIFYRTSVVSAPSDLPAPSPPPNYPPPPRPPLFAFSTHDPKPFSAFPNITPALYITYLTCWAARTQKYNRLVNSFCQFLELPFPGYPHASPPWVWKAFVNLTQRLRLADALLRKEILHIENRANLEIVRTLIKTRPELRGPK
ncbi:hypothetical protein L873DRAFT_1812885 [Choiromyces venosus 120613-1]|uniref:Uncharacterized protein n=1 Tax=Choiromyces venosus 120613-1 TaxID=1336337 RepID=A0A3N4JAU0_9PEZI|nr:hypothetical protein L873DRAFT_1812885 [Choiromyces venosus 120613-1]